MEGRVLDRDWSRAGRTRRPSAPTRRAAPPRRAGPVRATCAGGRGRSVRRGTPPRSRRDAASRFAASAMASSSRLIASPFWFAQFMDRVRSRAARQSADGHAQRPEQVRDVGVPGEQQDLMAALAEVAKQQRRRFRALGVDVQEASQRISGRRSAAAGVGRRQGQAQAQVDADPGSPALSWWTGQLFGRRDAGRTSVRSGLRLIRCTRRRSGAAATRRLRGARATGRRWLPAAGFRPPIPRGGPRGPAAVPGRRVAGAPAPIPVPGFPGGLDRPAPPTLSCRRERSSRSPRSSSWMAARSSSSS